MTKYIKLVNLLKFCELSMTSKNKRKTTKRRSTPNFNEPLKIINTGMKATVGIAALGITATALTNIAKK